MTVPTLADIEAARARLAGRARETPVYGSETFGRIAGTRVWLKAENLQRTGSFKIRGAVNKLLGLSETERAAGVIAASAGNHGQAVAWAARELGIAATVFMPQDAPMAKVEATRNYGAETILTGAMFDDALAEATARAAETGATFVHAFEDPAVIAGQGTIGLELVEEIPDAKTFLLPIGGGGLASGIAIALRALRPGVRIVGVQAGKTGHGTIADGIFVKHPGALTMSILDDLLDDIVHVEDDAIAEAIVLLLERSKLVVEGAGAASVAALLHGAAGGPDVCALLSGGNIDATLLVSVVRHGLTRAGRYLVLRSRVLDRPGELIKLLELVAAERGNIVEINHRREGIGLDVVETGVELTIATRDEEHCRELVAALEARGYPVELSGTTRRSGGS
ncbi:MAG TPA: threonine ammonia-lyase [Gaiellaceae bacterium]|jgi:threonine dehydratase|nr:threonine ammonia-lyase [Gaiellaceae bacterium]